MKHTEFEPALSNIKNLAIAELREALNAYENGQYFFPEGKTIRLLSGVPVLFVSTKTVLIVPIGANFATFSLLETLTIGDILKLTEAIPATKEVDNVSHIDEYNSSPDLLKLTL